MKLTKEQEVLFQLLRGELRELPANFDPGIFIRLLQRHKLLPVAEQLLHLVDQRTHEEWKSRLHSWAFRSTALLQELKTVATLLQDQQIGVTAAKGPTLSYLLYGNVHARFYSDIDIIVPPDQLAGAINILTGNGYRMIRPTTHPEQFDWERYFRDLNDVGLVCADRKVYIELHHGIYKPGLLEREAEQPLLDDHQTLNIQGTDFRVPGPEAYLLYLCYHGSAHMFFRLTWLRDVASYLERVDFDHAAFVGLTTRLRMEKMVGLSLVLARKYFKTNIPSALEHFTTGKGLRTVVWLTEEAIRGPGRASLTHNIFVLRGRGKRVKGIDRAGVWHWVIRLLYAVVLRNSNNEKMDVFKRMFYKKWLSKKI